MGCDSDHLHCTGLKTGLVKSTHSPKEWTQDVTPGSMTLEPACITTTASCSSDQVAFWNRHNLGLFHHRDNDVEANQVTLVSRA